MTQTFHFKTFVLVFFRKHVFTSSCVWILYLLEDLVVFSFFCSKRYFHWPFPSSVEFVSSSCLAFSFPACPCPVSGGWLSAARLGVQETLWDLWRIHGCCKDDFSEYFRFPLCFIPLVLRNHISLIYRRYQLASLNKHTHTHSLSPFPVSNSILPVVVYFHRLLKVFVAFFLPFCCLIFQIKKLKFFRKVRRPTCVKGTSWLRFVGHTHCSHHTR